MESKMILQGGWADQGALRVHWGVLTMYLSCIRGQGFVGGFPGCTRGTLAPEWSGQAARLGILGYLCLQHHEEGR